MLKKYEQKINDLQDAFDRDMIALAELAFEEKIKPWLEKHGYSFTAGSGDWIIVDEQGEYIYSFSDKIPKTIKGILFLETLNSRNYLGSLMPSWRPYKKPTTGKYSVKPYRCTGCGTEKDIGTNHWGECYPHCYKCMKQTVWECLEPVPEGYSVPEPWKMVKLGDIAEIKIRRIRR